ncbi:mitochondrial ribonuclease P catalytic subunit isoform X1 [Hypomesus transpacificus]|uniref:mitochondrial ribonuclease P catalytic subunit isoform X1 n=1 Tax=Hypomesus transpacificus TaxID=137520 RepID=UPI001F074017|nr:mitochondrial ribonuclease P catalytic subunit isoform X1 [Hypomesus transpacificus]
MGSMLISKSGLYFKYGNILSHPRTVGCSQLRILLSVFEDSKLHSAHLFSTKRVSRPLGYQNKKEDRQKDFIIRESPSFPKSVFAAGTAKKTAEILRRKSGLQEAEESDPRQPRVRVELPDRPLTASEWRKLQEASGNHERFPIQTMTSLFAQRAEIDVAKSLLAFVATETGTLPYKMLLRYLTLCVAAGHHGEVFDLYDIMTGRFGSLDTGAYSLFIRGFSHTERWRKALDILEDMKRVITPSSRNYGCVIAGAVQHGDVGMAWALYDDLIEKGLVPNQEIWQSLFQSGMSWPGPEQEERLQGVLMYMRDNQVYPQQSLAQTIEAWFQSIPEMSWKGSWTTVEPKGVCRSCKEELESIHLTQEEYSQLRERVMREVIRGQDVFNKTTPEELESFKTFVKRKPAFDVVIDGLNVANTTRGSQSETLLAVVSELEQQGQVILVLGRKHMLNPSRSWDRHHMAQVQLKAHCFFTDNISEDDPFLLYATLHSGNHCNFVSRDLMRDHKACLSDDVTRRLFFKWQRGHQLVLSGYNLGRRVRFRVRGLERIPSYDTIIQTSGRSWHVPYDDDGAERCSYEVPQRWLCLRKTH